MTANGLLQIAIYLIVLLLLVKPVGWYMAKVYMGQPGLLDPVFGPLERWIYRLCRIQPEGENGGRTTG